ncbi:major facilitator superfamily domain-containing protein [Chaetomium fimeti]|uniref:Major facilitator superfamily domain-containing protein n=1 Tax=Chaetomium fimeti TaxID=1854472 RepID=A0AAE0HH83_9PEZI|nr:major facilitator superfamily domain-containing protein [Chaetomium fimeti]
MEPTAGSTVPEQQTPENKSGPQQVRYGWRFWAILVALSFTSILAGLEIGCIATAMPTMVKELGSGGHSETIYVWVANAYFLTMTAFQPLYGQASNIFGRRTMTLLSVILFAIGSAVSGAATSMAMLVVGRAIMGAGGGGILVMIEIIICDLCPLRDRPKYLGMVMSIFGVAMCVGPLIGGGLAEHASWRWIFYLNLPVSAVSLVPLLLFLRVRYNRDSIGRMLMKVDWGGNALFAASVTAVLLALSWAGTEYPWSSWRTLVPLILGILGLGVFLGIESTTLIAQPTMPLRLFAHRTSLGAFGLTFIASILTYWMAYWLPIYFQAVKESTPTQSGIDTLPVSMIMIPFSILAGGGVTAAGRFRPFQFIGISLFTVSMGLFSMLDIDSSKGYWVGFQVVAAAGSGMLLTCTLPAVQAPLPDSDVAIATATWGFLRSFGGVWGIAIPTAIFNSHVNSLLDGGRVGDATVADSLRNGGAYGLASIGFIQSLPQDIKHQVKTVYVDSLRLIWQVAIGFGLLGFLVALVIKEVKMREDLKTDFGLIEGKNDSPANNSATVSSAEQSVEAGHKEGIRE